MDDALPITYIKAPFKHASFGSTVFSTLSLTILWKVQRITDVKKEAAKKKKQKKKKQVWNTRTYFMFGSV